MAIQPKVSVRSVMDYCAFNPLSLQIKRQMINDEILNGVFNNKAKAIAKVNKYLDEHSCSKIVGEERYDIKYEVREAVMDLFRKDKLTPSIQDDLRELTKPIKDEYKQSHKTRVAREQRERYNFTYDASQDNEKDWLNKPMVHYCVVGLVLDRYTQQQSECYTRTGLPYKNKKKFKMGMETRLYQGWAYGQGMVDKIPMMYYNLYHVRRERRVRPYKEFWCRNDQWTTDIWRQMKEESGSISGEELMRIHQIKKHNPQEYIQSKMVEMYC